MSVEIYKEIEQKLKSRFENSGGFLTLGDLPAPPAQHVPRTFRWGLQRPDLVRYNRVEGLSMGARGQVRPDTRFGPLSVTATARVEIEYVSASRHQAERRPITTANSAS